MSPPTETVQIQPVGSLNLRAKGRPRKTPQTTQQLQTSVDTKLQKADEKALTRFQQACRERIEELIALAFHAAKVAAAKGDDRPSRWLLEHAGQAPQLRVESTPTGPQIQIGIALPGSAQASQGPYLTVRTDERTRTSTVNHLPRVASASDAVSTDDAER
jgi:hypothetical protein